MSAVCSFNQNPFFFLSEKQLKKAILSHEEGERLQAETNAHQLASNKAFIDTIDTINKTISAKKTYKKDLAKLPNLNHAM
jgi:Zn-finger protein